MSIKVENLTKVYGEQKAVNNISFEAKPGEILGFLGPNGAGKSTTMKIATCYVPPTEGTIKICDYDVVENPIEVRKMVGYLPEHNPLYLDMYVREYLEYSAAIYNIKGQKRKQRVDEMIELTGLTRERKKKIGALSKGYRQRVGLAQALIHDPEVLILDEPTTGLDPIQLEDIRALIKKVSQNKTVMLSTHIMQEVQILCDRVVIIRKGDLVADDKVENLRHYGAKTALNLKFESPTSAAFLSSIEGVEKIEIIDPANVLVYYANDLDLRGDIFRKSATENQAIIEMNMQIQSMEEIFTQLAQG
ncbi:gliding motility-associated ABC transporter ATP-binding subunit GldA [Flammeovirga kamogawensis]|uniref:Gliding motility-associated ABC transporter ATP-binding subunit GldA n=1 Tax=Flammeovirga kamogawensis TaxID=373891 RepID=A0ABX8GZF4_9BACT|nr:gliding motility-associated ABC transporter ATP-binding subunit GldA [Flammeovirga kamogawensis]MBB6459157.1 ABC-2 type transport system ATP-binding protein [Flammeovirga kamogawensis]QWG08723.1 gliding motility-associated ABC transporter ATP-binding subunit GldA [Flammeovirga kamogawensis]TRX67016.1 gliding motility-associated ABC transporter ATP-binding subunit GldA [Flammeovirga kamogawensis]